MMRSTIPFITALVLLGTCPVASGAQGDGPDQWKTMRRGAWVRPGGSVPVLGEVTLVGAADSASPAPVLVVGRGESPFVRRAAESLAADIERIADVRPAIVSRLPDAGRAAIVIETARAGSDTRWEAYSVTIAGGRVRIQGSNPRGTAFGIYELCERIGVDPLYHWTGFTPQKQRPLILRPTRFSQGPPAVRFRGLFHDDEDILPRPLLPSGAPDANGVVPTEWYARYFETALRLRMNMVAPWVRVDRRFEIQKMASDWGLYYTSHHYDTLLSDPYHFNRRPWLAKARGVEPVWDWIKNRDGLIRYWRAGVEENKNLHAIYPIGMRGTNDYGYPFPREWTEDQRIGAYNEALQTQADLIKKGLPRGGEPLMHFTMYTEMLPYYQTGKLKVPTEATIVWPDNNDGEMRGLPQNGRTTPNRHGVYYHLAYLGQPGITKQTHQTISLDRIGREFRGILSAGATEFCLVNVSEVREYVLGTRYIADICWNGEAAVRSDDSPRQFLQWWSREYFGAAAAPAVASAYDGYFALLPTTSSLANGAEKTLGAVESLGKKFRGEPFPPARPETLPNLTDRHAKQMTLLARISEAEKAIPPGEARTFFFENLTLAAAMDRLPTEAALLLVPAMTEPDRDRAYDRSLRALLPLDRLDLLLRRAERSPFEGWYGLSWIGTRNRLLVYPRRELVTLLEAAGKSGIGNGN
ncbi:MAG: glycosyl hydrolase 115 family protein [Armatimonadota bacterium]